MSQVSNAPGTRRRKLLVIAAGLLGVLGVVLGGFLYLRHAANRELRQAVAAIDAEDTGWRLQDLEANRAAVAEDRNSAACVARVATIMAPRWPPWDNLKAASSAQAARKAAPNLVDVLRKLPANVALGPEEANELGAGLNKAMPALVEARKLRDLPAGRYPIAWDQNLASCPVDHLSDVRNTATLLRYDAILLAHNRDGDGALASARGVLNAGRSIGDEPSMSSQGLRLVTRVLAAITQERVLGQSEPSDGALAATQDLLADEIRVPLLRVTARGERALAHAFMEAIEKGEMRLDGLPPSPQRTLGDIVQDYAMGRLVWQQHLWTLRWFTEWIRAADLEQPQQIERFRQLERQAKSNPPPFPSLAPVLAKIAARYHQTQAQLGCALVALAAERYRRQTGRWPDSPAALVPAYLKELPADPFDGKPLHYRRLEDGVAIYSVGPDGKNDGGVAESGSGTTNDGNLRFRLWDTANRRRPPAG